MAKKRDDKVKRPTPEAKVPPLPVEESIDDLDFSPAPRALEDEAPKPLPESSSSDSAIDLGQPGVPQSGVAGGTNPSDISGIQWSSLVEDEVGKEGAGSAVRIDSPSDADLLLPEPVPPGAPETDYLLAVGLEEYSFAADDVLAGLPPVTQVVPPALAAPPAIAEVPPAHEGAAPETDAVSLADDHALAADLEARDIFIAEAAIPPSQPAPEPALEVADDPLLEHALAQHEPPVQPGIAVAEAQAGEAIDLMDIGEGAEGIKLDQGVEVAEGTMAIESAEDIEIPAGAEALEVAGDAPAIEIAEDAAGIEIAEGVEAPPVIEIAEGAEGIEIAEGAEGIEIAAGAEGIEIAAGAEGIEIAAGAEGIEIAAAPPAMEVAEPAAGIAIAEAPPAMEVAEAAAGIAIAEGAAGIAIAEAPPAIAVAEAAAGIAIAEASPAIEVTEGAEPIPLAEGTEPLEWPMPEDLQPVASTESPEPVAITEATEAVASTDDSAALKIVEEMEGLDILQSAEAVEMGATVEMAIGDEAGLLLAEEPVLDEAAILAELTASEPAAPVEAEPSALDLGALPSRPSQLGTQSSVLWTGKGDETSAQADMPAEGVFPASESTLDLASLFDDPGVVEDVAADAVAAEPAPSAEAAPLDLADEIPVLDEGTLASAGAEEPMSPDEESLLVDIAADAALSGTNVVQPGTEEPVAATEEALFATEEASPEHGDSGIDLGLVEQVQAETASGGLALDPIVALDSSNGLDPIAEAVESGTDMRQPIMEIEDSEPAPVVPPSRRSEIQLEDPDAPERKEDTSSVNLGGLFQVPEEGLIAHPEGGEVAEAAAGEVGHEIDLAGMLADAGSVSGSSVPAEGPTEADIEVPEPAAEEKAATEPAAEESDSFVNMAAAEAGAGAEAASGEETLLKTPTDEESLVDMPIEEETEAALKPSKAEKPAKRGGSWVGGTVIGTLVGTAACLALWVGGYEPPEQWRDMMGMKSSKPAPATVRPVMQAPQLTAEDYLARFDLPKAKEAIDAIDPATNDPKQLLLRGQIAWETYLQDQAKAKIANPKADDKPVQQAIKDLEKAQTPEALFQLGQIYELTGKLDEAEKVYKQGLEKNQNDKRFKAALKRVEQRPADAPARGAWLDRREEQLLMAALLATLLQPPANPPADDAGPEEAGFDFWEAYNHAGKQEYVKAIEKLDSAIKQHELRRLVRLRRPQNPLSDPTEEIFLRSCKQLRLLWNLQGMLRGGNYIAQADKKDDAAAAATAKAVDELVVIGQQSQKLGEKMIDAKVIDKKEDFKQGVEKLLADNQKFATDLADTTKKLETKTKEADDAGKLATVLKDKLAKVEGDLKDTEAKRKDAQARADLLDKTLTEASDELIKNKYLDPAAKNLEVLKGIKAALELANTKDPQGELRSSRLKVDQLTIQLKTETDTLKKQREDDLAALDKKRLGELAALDKKRVDEITTLDKLRIDQVTTLQKELKDQETRLTAQRVMEVGALTAQLKERWLPAEMLTLWLPLLRDRNRPDLPVKAVLDVNRVLADARAPVDLKAKAQLIEGLALRNQEKYAEAKVKLAEGLQGINKDERGWIEEARLALQEVTNPAAFLLLVADTLANEGRMLEALDRLNRGIARLPEGQGPLLAQRSLLQLEMARNRTNGRARANDVQVAAAQKDAGEAIKRGAAMGHYAAARIAEELGDLDDAIAEYQAAENALPAEEVAMKGKCRIARARLLTLPRPWRPAAPPRPQPMPDANRVGRVNALSEESVASLVAEEDEEAQLRMGMLALMVTMLQPVPGQLASPDQIEAQRIADEILAAKPGTYPGEVVAQALAIKGFWTQALRAYVETIKPQMRRDQADGLQALIDGHPSLKRPDSLRIPNAMEAESQYATGVRRYFGRDYSEAEKSLLEAIRLNGGDARYYYFLGLARLMQGNREAYEDFNRGALLEKDNRPGRALVSQALERVQGPIRQIVNDAREKPAR